MIYLFYKKIAIFKREKGAVALTTLIFLAFFFTLALTSLWTVTQLLAARSLIQETAQTAAYAAANTTNGDPNNTEIDCENATADNLFLCKEDSTQSQEALNTVRSVFATAFKPDGLAVFDLCYSVNTAACAGKNIIRLRARSREAAVDPTKESIKVFRINSPLARRCVVETVPDRDLGRDLNPRFSDPALGDGLCWLFSERRSWRDNSGATQSGFFRIKNFSYNTSGVIVRARAKIEPFFDIGEMTIEGFAVAVRGQPLAPGRPGDY